MDTLFWSRVGTPAPRQSIRGRVSSGPAAPLCFSYFRGPSGDRTSHLLLYICWIAVDGSTFLLGKHTWWYCIRYPGWYHGATCTELTMLFHLANCSRMDVFQH